MKPNATTMTRTAITMTAVLAASKIENARESRAMHEERLMFFDFFGRNKLASTGISVIEN